MRRAGSSEGSRENEATDVVIPLVGCNPVSQLIVVKVWLGEGYLYVGFV
jgi:hypothetical protein